jgi:hypothetical protein
MLAACAAVLLAASPAAAQDVDLDVPLQDDLVVNDDGGVDGADTAIDPNYNLALATQSAVADHGGCGDVGDRTGLRDDGVFAPPGPRPEFELQTQNSNDGDNGFLFDADLETFTVDVPDGSYGDLHLAAVSGGFNQNRLEVEFTYTDGTSTTAGKHVPVWYESSGGYPIDGGNDAMSPDGANCQDYDQATLWGVTFKVADRPKRVDSVKVTRRDVEPDPNRRISVFGGVLTPSHGLTVTKAGTGGGTVATRTSTAIACGADCSETYGHGDTVILVATPDEGSTFEGWSGPCAVSGASCTLSMTAARSVTATFERVPPPPADQPQPQPQPGPQPPLPPGTGATTRTVPFGTLVSARRACGRRRLRLAVDDVPGETIVEAIFRIGERSRRRGAALIDDPFFFGRVSRRAFRLRVEMKTADGDTLRASRRFARCPRARRRRA